MQMKNLYLAFLIVLFQSSTVNASLYDFAFSITGSGNPTMTLENSGGALISALCITIGDTVYNFDSSTVSSAIGIGYDLIIPDTNSTGGVRSDEIRFTFTVFDNDEKFRFTGEIDVDNANTSEIWHVIMINNGALPNSILSVDFADHHHVDLVLPDAPAPITDYSVSYQADLATPLPASALLFGSVLSGLIVIRRKR
jgi:hypothetical protein